VTARIAIMVVVALAIVIELFVPDEAPRTYESTTHGTMPWGYRAVHDLLVELGAPGRFEARVDELPARATAWWIGPPGICDDVPDPTGEVQSWIDAGGVAVVFVPADIHQTNCRFAGTALPPAVPPTAERIEGLGPSRRVHINNLYAFANVDDTWIVRARYGRAPFVIERVQQQGALIAVADARILRNETLAVDDVALVAADLARAYGLPRVVERIDPAADGRSRSAVVYLLRSPAIALLAGLALTGILAAWSGSLIPPRTVDGEPVPAPTLQRYVASLATLYAGSHDYPRLLARYRELTARRLRRYLGLPAHASLDAVAARVERARPARRDARALLVDPLDATTAADLHAAAARLDALAAEVIG
jgi:hypothetical protein